MIGNTQTRHCIFLSVHNQLGRIRIKSIRLERININLGQTCRQLLLGYITESVFLRLPGSNITTVQFTRTVKILIIALLFSQAKPYIVGISLTLILYGEPYSKTFAGIDYLIVISIHKLVYFDNQHSRFNRHGNRLLLLSHILRFFQCLFIGRKTRRKGGIRSPILNDFVQHLIFRFHIHILIHPGQSLHIHFGRRIFLQNFQEEVFGIHQITRCTLTYQSIFRIVGNSGTIVHNLRSTVKVGTCHSRHQFKTLRVQCIETFINIQCLHILSLTLQDACLDRQHFIIIRVDSQNTVYCSNQLLHIIGSNMHIHQIV